MYKLSITLALYLISGIPAFSQSILVSQDSSRFEMDIDEVTVVSSKDPRDNKLIELPASVSVIKTINLEKEEIRSMSGLSGIIPNLFMPDYGTRLTSPVYLRGIGSRINSPSVGLYVDNVPYFEKAAFDFDFYDIERVEVLRGPQGTLFGRNTMGGIINIYTRDPSSVPETRLEISGANYNYLKAMAGHSQPLGEKTSLMVNAAAFHYGGNFENQYNGRNVDAMHSYTGRIKLSHDASRRFKAMYSMNIEKSFQEGYPYAILDPLSSSANDINYEHTSSYDRWLLSNNLNLKYFANKFTLNSTSSYQFLNGFQDIDQDFTPLKAVVVQQDQLQHMFSQEITLNSSTPSKYSYVFGLFGFAQLFDSQVDVFYREDAPEFNIPPGIDKYKNYDNTIAGAAVFHQSSLRDVMIDGLTLTAGVRLDYEKAKQLYDYDLLMGGNLTSIEKDYLMDMTSLVLLPKFSVKYQANPRLNTYATIARGYKTGGFNTTFERPEDESFDPESSWNYELGLKSRFAGNKVSASLAFFYIDWTHQQIYQSVPSGQGSMIKNAGESYSKGVEAEISVKPVSRLTLFTNFGYNEARFNEYLKNETTDYSGNYIPYAPKLTLYSGINYNLPLNRKLAESLFFQISYNGFGRHYWHEDNQDFQEFYGLLNANISVRNRFMEWSFWGKNILNADYNSFYFRAFGNSYVQKGKPVLFGSSIRVNL